MLVAAMGHAFIWNSSTYVLSISILLSNLSPCSNVFDVSLELIRTLEDNMYNRIACYANKYS